MSAPPVESIFEAERVHASGARVVVLDIAHLLPTLGGRPQPARRPGSVIERMYVHKSGAEGPDGVRGIKAMVQYVTTRRRPRFPGAPYTFWAARKPDIDHEGRLVLYRCVADDRRTWHTGGACNDHGVSLVLQGNLSKRDLMPDQRIVAEVGLLYGLERYAATLNKAEPIGRHSDAMRFGAPKNKIVCPGSFAEVWLDGFVATAQMAGLIG